MAHARLPSSSESEGSQGDATYGSDGFLRAESDDASNSIQELIQSAMLREELSWEAYYTFGSDPGNLPVALKLLVDGFGSKIDEQSITAFIAEEERAPASHADFVRLHNTMVDWYRKREVANTAAKLSPQVPCKTYARVVCRPLLARPLPRDLSPFIHYSLTPCVLGRSWHGKH